MHMNKVILMGRLTKDPDMRYTQGDNSTAVARFSLAVDRRRAPDGSQNADFPNCISFGKTAEFAGKYLAKGTKVVLTGRIQTGSYTNRDGVKVYTTDVVAEELEFAESKAASQGQGQPPSQPPQAGYNAPPQGGYGQSPVQGNYNNNYNQYGYGQPTQPPQAGYGQYNNTQAQYNVPYQQAPPQLPAAAPQAQPGQTAGYPASQGTMPEGFGAPIPDSPDDSGLPWN